MDTPPYSFIEALFSDTAHNRFFPKCLCFAADVENGLVAAWDYHEVLPQEDWQTLKEYVDRFYEQVSQAEIDELNRQSAEPKPKTKTAQNITKQNKRGCVYVLKSETGFFKIGRSKNLDSRLKSISTASPHNIQLVHSFKCADPAQRESELHVLFKKKRKRGEWFALTPLDIEQIRQIQDEVLV